MLDFPVVVCIGTPKVVGDSLGPLVGDILKKRETKAFVYGDKSRSVTALNFREYSAFINKKHPRSLVIAVDAGLSSDGDVGDIKLSTTGVCPGGALSKTLGKIGNIGVLGIVGRAGEENMTTLVNVKKELVESLALAVAEKVEHIIARAQLLSVF